MTVKEKLTEIFELNRGQYLSGEELASMLGCSRGAVWKAVKSLQNDGFRILAVTNKGYCLENSTDVMSIAGVKKYLDSDSENLDIEVYHSLESTNLTLRDYANNGVPEGKVVISGEQTKGRGRLGRTFYSPSDTGLYMSILLRPKMEASQAIRITTCAAVAVSQAIEKVTGKSSQIKWVNDVYIDGKKVCGILTEAAFSMETGGLDYAVLGIGVNCYSPVGDFPEEIKNVAGTVCNEPEQDLRNRLAGEILNSFMKLYIGLEDNSFCEEYRKRLMWKNEKIYVINAGTKTECTLIDVDEECRLSVRMENGEMKLISSGEISIRKA